MNKDEQSWESEPNIELERAEKYYEKRIAELEWELKCKQHWIRYRLPLELQWKQRITELEDEQHYLKVDLQGARIMMGESTKTWKELCQLLEDDCKKARAERDELLVEVKALRKVNAERIQQEIEGDAK